VNEPPGVNQEDPCRPLAPRVGEEGAWSSWARIPGSIDMTRKVRASSTSKHTNIYLGVVCHMRAGALPKPAPKPQGIILTYLQSHK
jgi:hypothetical protein